MKKHLCLILIVMLANFGFAQVIVTDFSLKAHNDTTTYNLYSILESGKAVFLDFFQPECDPCTWWHDYMEFEKLYKKHGPDGDNTAMCFMMNTYSNTGWPEITGDNSMNYDWAAGVTYPIITIPEEVQAQILNAYDAWGTPQVWKICPNKEGSTIENLHNDDNEDWEVSYEASLAGLEEWMSNTCSMAVSIEETLKPKTINVYPNPAKYVITIHSTTEITGYKIFNSMGQIVLFENNIKLTSKEVDVSSIITGMYYLQTETMEGIHTQKIQISK